MSRAFQIFTFLSDLLAELDWGEVRGPNKDPEISKPRNNFFSVPHGLEVSTHMTLQASLYEKLNFDIETCLMAQIVGIYILINNYITTYPLKSLSTWSNAFLYIENCIKIEFFLSLRLIFDALNDNSFVTTCRIAMKFSYVI